jgi:hypothetical protein
MSQLLKPETIGKQLWLLLLLSVVYAAVMLSLNGQPLTHLYEASPYHRLQAEALLEGHLGIGDSICQMNYGLAWHQGRVQQVWGLGVGLWILPFQALWRLLGGNMLPDRLALGAAFALLSFYAGSTGLRLAKRENSSAGLGLIWLILVSPPLWTLSRTSQLVFEETVLYGILLCLGILVGIIRVALFNSRRDFALICFLGAFSALVRPTLAVYGACGVVICALILYARRRLIREVLAGLLALGLGFCVLAATNSIRFGSVTEFGHRLTVSSGSIVYLSRFGNPYTGSGPIVAARELFGMLFLTPNVRDAGAFSENLVTWQGSATRWRRFYLTSFDWSYAVLAVVGAAASVSVVIRRRRSVNGAGKVWRDPANALSVGVLLWSSTSAITLALFYLHFPAMASRYLLDFEPCMAGFAILAWVSIPQWAWRISIPVLSLWLLFEIGKAKVLVGERDRPGRAFTGLVLPHMRGMALPEYGGVYNGAHAPGQTAIPGNGYGWDTETGLAEDVVVLAVDRPQRVELKLSGRRGLNGETAKNDTYRAMIDGVTLPIRSVTEDDGGRKVLFDIPDAVPRRGNDEFLFLCFSEGYEGEDRASERFLYSVRWK